MICQYVLPARRQKLKHLGRGILERDLEKMFPDVKTELILYCDGGFRSALSAETAQKLDYKNVFSLAGGYKAMKASGWPMINPI
ncbi:MAG TPA: rhodanese-like domain-containing protein [Verrucomicrobiae bacterium]